MKRLFSLLALTLCLLSCKKEMESGTGSLYGTVKAYGLEIPLSDCKVSLEPAGLSTKTFEDGEFEFESLKSGYYSITASRRGYQDKSAVVKVTAGETTVIVIKLESSTPYSLSESELNFGDLQESMIIRMYNNSDEECTYSISDVPSWMSLTPKTGTIRSLSTAQIEATVNRSAINYGKTTATLVFSFAGKVKMNLNVNASVEKVKLSAPTVTCSSSAAELKHASFKITGTLSATGGQEVTEHGHCWSTSPSPTINNSRTRLGAKTSVGNFTSTITGLTASTKYYVRAYAVNAQGTSYSGQVTVQTPAVYTDKWNGAIASSFSMGSGTATDPYVITTGGELQLVKNYPSAYYVLGNNIDLNHHNWAPYSFSGSFDGKGYVIYNLYIDSTSNNLGLFSTISSGAKVKNITLNGVNIDATNSDYVGAIAGQISSSVGYLENCKVILTADSIIKGDQYVGGIIGYISYMYSYYDNVLLGCEVSSLSDSSVIIGNDKVGGIIGHGGCERCNVAADIKGGSNVGGICGYASATVAHSSFKGKIEAERAVGGIVGYLDQDVWIASCKADVNILVDNNSAGGILGDTDCHVKVAACYATGTVNASSSNSSYLGGLIGKVYYDVSIYDSYAIVSSSSNGFDGISGYYSSTSPIPSYCCTVFDTYYTKNDTKGYCTDITSHLRAANSDYSQFWNFDNTWTWTGTVKGKTVNVSCPRLLWE